jgi:hypothetical protein
VLHDDDALHAMTGSPHQRACMRCTCQLAVPADVLTASSEQQDYHMLAERRFSPTIHPQPVLFLSCSRHELEDELEACVHTCAGRVVHAQSKDEEAESSPIVCLKTQIQKSTTYVVVSGPVCPESMTWDRKCVVECSDRVTRTSIELMSAIH